MERFDPLHPIARETVLLEASAGTGKTYSISGKIVRLVAEEGIDIDRVLIVTFTRAATAELVDRIRSILIEARDAIDGLLEPGHLVITALRERSAENDELRELYLTRLKRAIARFDLASIYTIHSFSERALSLAAFEVGFDPSSELVADIRGAIERASDDLYLEALARDEERLASGEDGERPLRETPYFDRRTLQKIAAARWSLQDAAIAQPDEESVWSEAIIHFCDRIVERIERELERRRAIGFDQLINHLKRALEDERSRDGLLAALRARYDAALIDEFQDTDEAQWAIFSAIFGEGKIFELVGDPKQAIYSFRGADIEVYKRARREASRRFTLDINYRSSPEYIEAMNLLFGTSAGLDPNEGEPRMSAPFVSPEIPYLKVGANLAADRPRLVSSDGEPFTPLRILRCAVGEGERATVAEARARANHLLADEILSLLERGEFRQGDERRRVRPSDIAILTRKRMRGAAIAELLRERGVRCVSPKESPLFLSEAAVIVENLLQLSLDPTHRPFLRSLAFGPLFSLQRREFDEDEERHLEFQIAGIVEEFREGLVELGVGASLLRLLSRPFERRQGEPELILSRLLSREGGERMMTDLRHLIEALHLEAIEGHLSPSAILKLLQERRGDAKGEADDEAYAVRLESDADALTITTMHASKGLEYPIVFLPELDEFRKQKADDLFVYSEDERRVIDPFIGAKGETRRANQEIADRMNFEESLRLLYVAFTRARYHCVAIFHPIYRGGRTSKKHPLGRLQWGSVEASPLAHIVYRGAPDGAEALITEAINEESIERIDEVGDALAASSLIAGEARIGYQIIRGFSDLPAYRGDADHAELSPPASYTGPSAFFSFFGRHSYTQVVRYGRDEKAAGLLGVMGEHGGSDEGHADSPAIDKDAKRDLILANFPKGARPGSFIHFLLEELDFKTGAPKDSARTLHELMSRSAAKAGFFGERRAAFALLEEALPSVLATPLGGNLGQLSLSDLEQSDRLDELDFVMPIAGESFDEAPRVEVAQLPDIFGRGHAAPIDYAIEGFMNGSIDLVFRAPDTEGQLRYYLADYKSNALGGAESYHPEQLRAAMDTHEYWIQAAFYLLALDSFLAHRLGEAYDYERDFGGVYYLFLRGMTGEDARLPGEEGVRGVLALRPDEGEMESLRRWLREGRPNDQTKTRRIATREGTS